MLCFQVNTSEVEWEDKEAMSGGNKLGCQKKIIKLFQHPTTWIINLHM